MQKSKQSQKRVSRTRGAELEGLIRVAASEVMPHFRPDADRTTTEASAKSANSRAKHLSTQSKTTAPTKRAASPAAKPKRGAAKKDVTQVVALHPPEIQTNPTLDVLDELPIAPKSIGAIPIQPIATLMTEVVKRETAIDLEREKTTRGPLAAKSMDTIGRIMDSSSSDEVKKRALEATEAAHARGQEEIKAQIDRDREILRLPWYKTPIAKTAFSVGLVVLTTAIFVLRAANQSSGSANGNKEPSA